jgi:hypothetical protein
MQTLSCQSVFYPQIVDRINSLQRKGKVVLAYLCTSLLKKKLKMWISMYLGLCPWFEFSKQIYTFVSNAKKNCKQFLV